ncbi:MAG: C25 family cysteine peptidase, partial [Candidatus Fermentibacteria bacterium]|nr:C25 family cysteine peptidase [Candidatus Fermentibacteria bacterium]
MLSLLIFVLVSDTAPIHTTTADSSHVSFIAQTPLTRETVQHDSLDYIRFTDISITDSIGFPELPMITCLVAVPDSVTPDIEFAFSDETTQSVVPVYPAPARVISYEYYCLRDQGPSFDFGTDCIAEKMFKNTAVPVAGVFASSQPSDTGNYSSYGMGILEAIYARGHGRLGDAIASARTEYMDDFLSADGSFTKSISQYNLLGDPALDISDRVRYPNKCDLEIYTSDINIS